MQDNKRSASSSSMDLGQVYALFKGIRPSESTVKGFLYLIGLALTPLSLFGALMGYKRAYELFGFPNAEKPTLKNLKPIMWLSMLIGVIIAWVLLGIIIYFLGKVAGTMFGGRGSAQVMIIFLAFNLVCSIGLFRYFSKWQSKVLSFLSESSRFGSARWANDEDLKGFKNRSGFYIGGGQYGFDGRGHKVTIGGTRGGKGVNSILPNLLGLLDYVGSWFIIDVKGELAAISSRYQKENGQDVFILDPWGLNTTEGSTYNPLDLVVDQTDPDCLIDDISIIAEMIVEKETKSEAFWSNKARSLVSSLILHLMMTENKENRTLTKLWTWLRLPTEKFEELLADMAVSDSAIVRATGNEYASIMHTSDKMFQSILSVAQEKTDFLKSPALQKSLASSNFNVKDITNGKTTLYVIIPPDKLDTHYQWLRLVMTTALRSSVRNHDKRITFLLDEFASLGVLPEMRTALSTYAGYNISMWPIIQDLSQLKNLYSQSWETFISNTAIRQFTAVSDLFTLEYISKLMGTTTTVSYDASDPNAKANASARPLATPDEIRRGSEDNMFTFIGQKPVACLPKLPYYEMKSLDGRYDENPYFKQ